MWILKNRLRNVRRITIYLILITLIFTAFNFLLFQRIDAAFQFFTTYLQYLSYEYSISKGSINSSFPITFYHEAYLDLRMSPPRLRLYSLNPCIRKSNLLVVDVFVKGSKRAERLEMEGESLEEYCPSMDPLAMPCFYQPYSFSVDVKESTRIDKVEVILDDHRVSLSVKEVAKEREEGLTVCVQPVYYYSQWQNVLLYLEAWRAHGARRFVVFFHSASRETLSVLRHYEALGALELRAWPSFGAPRQEGFPSVDESVFIFSYYLAMNVCLQDVRTSLATVADFDELLVPLEGSLLDYSLAQMRHSNVGALRFESNHVAMHPSIYSNDFSGVGSPKYYKRYGAPKHIFNASVVDVAQVHYIRSFIEPKITKAANGITFHFRYGNENYPKMEDKKQFSFFPNQTEMHIQNIKNTANKIFNGSLPQFDESLIKEMKSCAAEIRDQKEVCMSKSGKCREDMDKLYDWVYDTTQGVFLK